ncbi:hypothetical protein SOVF_149370 [Spinacia oleracea]|uniref:Squamosa promoter-binding-like protein 4 n=1 Tax=Spinacia oleracea TaxID=3562 RepID=A0A9R0JQQ6_SPIOL|nr:squamosa promoter-binding-like protein 4 [Spinacia oleracea]KNA09892.1 hypothetical protein SOVF_149370 [Spinacia oleracea]
MDFHKQQNTSATAASASAKRMMMTMIRDKAAKLTTTTTTNKTSIKCEDHDQNSDDRQEEMSITTPATCTPLTEEKKQKRLSSTSGKKVTSVGSSGGGWGGGVTSCQAEKCAADLTDAKRYHRRHKVCEFHAKAPSALVSGLRQRFCQQCSRFHELSEFDDTKRSCRRRLAGHNERRRKNSMEPAGPQVGERGINLQLRPEDQESPISFSASAGTNSSYKQLQIR